MRTMILAGMAALLATPALADGGEVNYREGALGFDAIVAQDYEKAEAQLLKANGVSRNDPARLINLGHVFAKTGRAAEAKVMFTRAADARDVALVLADGSVASSRELAQAALSQLDD
ncbi:tetratricopeptide repeat protein [Sphingomicrobium nitratireducens]|uniref:tetratricopeptide repeat protein n=1 Tax=Sphingomicrobium nitratireducens TaxID=2964666 RepID=UPI00223F8D2A|nr:tetratricopeptide repeat protein [Sphingomicrobium nitratireducens]